MSISILGGFGDILCTLQSARFNLGGIMFITQQSATAMIGNFSHNTKKKRWGVGVGGGGQRDRKKNKTVQQQPQ
jgi:hypothetical protein